MKRLTVFSLIILCVLFTLPANITVQANQYASDAAFVADVTVADDTVFAPGERCYSGLPSLLGHPQQDEPIDPEVTPTGSPEPGDVIDNIAQHVAEGLAEGERYEVRAIDEAVMFRDKAAWDSGESAKQTDWWEVIRVEGDFVWGKDSEGNKFCVSANGDPEATHLDLRLAEISDEDLEEGVKLVKDVSESQVQVEIDIEKLNQIISEPKKIIGKQPLYEDSGMEHKVSSADGRTETKISPSREARIGYGGEILVLVEVLVDGEIYVKKVDGKELIAWMPIRGLADAELSALSVDELRALGFGVENQSIAGRSMDSLSDEERQLVIFRKNSGEKIANKRVPTETNYNLWETNTAPKYKEGEHLYQTYGLAAVIREIEVSPDTSDAVLTMYSNRYTHGPKEDGIKKTVKVHIDLAEFDLKLLSVKRNDKNWWFDIIPVGDWSVNDFNGRRAFFDIETGQQHQKIINFLSNQTSEVLEVRMNKGTIEVYGD